MGTKLAAGLLTSIFAFALTVAAMTWPKLPSNLGVPIIIVCLIGMVVAGAFWYRFAKSDAEERHQMASDKPRPPLVDLDGAGTKIRDSIIAANTGEHGSGVRASGTGHHEISHSVIWAGSPPTPPVKKKDGEEA